MKNSLLFYPRYLVVAIIRVYQHTLSFDYGWFHHLFPYGFCRFKPTCSEYAIAAITKYGVIRGGSRAAWRVLRCNPFNKGGWDPVK